MIAIFFMAVFFNKSYECAIYQVGFANMDKSYYVECCSLHIPPLPEFFPLQFNFAICIPACVLCIVICVYCNLNVFVYSRVLINCIK